MENEQSRHHRKPKSIGGSHEPPNTIKVCHKKHEAWHVVFSNKSAEEIVKDLNDMWIDPEYVVVLIKKKDRGHLLQMNYSEEPPPPRPEHY